MKARTSSKTYEQHPFAKKKKLAIYFANRQAGTLRGSTPCYICHGMKVNKASLDVLITAISERQASDISKCRLSFC